jgi:hypothetical protein
MSKILHSLGPMRPELLLCPGRVPTGPTHTKGRSPYRECKDARPGTQGLSSAPMRAVLYAGCWIWRSEEPLLLGISVNKGKGKDRGS